MTLSALTRTMDRRRGGGAGEKIAKFRIRVKLQLSVGLDVGRLQQNAAVLVYSHEKALVGSPGQDGAAACVGFDERRFSHKKTIPIFL